MLFEILAFVILLFLSAYFSSTETAFTSLSALQLHKLNEKSKSGRLVYKLSKRPEKLLTTILIGNNLVNIAATAITTDITIKLFGSTAIGVMTGVLTIIILIFGEVSPKHIAISKNEAICLRSAFVIDFLSRFLTPIIWFVTKISSLITKSFVSEKDNVFSLENIIRMINIGENMGIVENYENNMIRRIFLFNDINIETVMTHRTEVFSLDKELTIKEGLDTIIESGFSRIPVYDKDPERVVGIVLLKDVMKMVSQKKLNMNLKEIMVSPLYISDSKKANELFAIFKEVRLNIAVVLDEYGGLAGIVTREDVIESILGDLYDEDEEHEWKKITKISENEYKIIGDTPLYQINDALKVGLEEARHIQTISGYISNLTGSIPNKDDVIKTGNLEFTVEEVSRKKILSLNCKILKKNK